MNISLPEQILSQPLCLPLPISHALSLFLSLSPSLSLSLTLTQGTMADITPVRLLVILSEDNSARMELRNGIPNSLEELIEEVKDACGLGGYIKLQYKDADFGNILKITTTKAANGPCV